MTVVLQDHLTYLDDFRIDTSTDTVDPNNEGVRAINHIINDLRLKHKWEFTVKRTLFNYYADIREYPLASNYDGLIGLYEQQNYLDPFDLVGPVEFDRKMNQSTSDFMIAEENFQDKSILKVNFPYTKSTKQVVDENMDATDWVASGTASGLSADTVVYFDNNGSLRFDLTGAGTGILTANLTNPVDLSSLKSDYKMFQKLFFPGSGITSVSLKWGSGVGDYYERTLTSQFNGKSFESMLNVLGFDISDATETGTVVDSAIDYLQISIVHTATIKNCRLSGLVARTPDPMVLEHYSTDWIYDVSASSWVEKFDNTDPSSDYGAWSGTYDWFQNLINAGSTWFLLNEMQEDTRADKFKVMYQGLDQEQGRGGLVGQAIKELPSRLKKKNAPRLILASGNKMDYYD